MTAVPIIPGLNGFSTQPVAFIVMTSICGFIGAVCPWFIPKGPNKGYSINLCINVSFPYSDTQLNGLEFEQ